MTNAPPQRPDLPEYMTWEELEQLPAEVAGQIELWDGRVVWLRRGPGEHQEFSNLLWSGLRRSAKSAMGADPRQCWSVRTETNIFFGDRGRSDFVTPDFMIHRVRRRGGARLHPANYLLVGEWTPKGSDAIRFDHPFPIELSWADLEFLT